MKTVEVDDQVYDYISRNAIPFEETSPNMVLRRLFGLPPQTTSRGITHKPPTETFPADGSTVPRLVPSSDLGRRINALHDCTQHVHPAFLTFLMDKNKNTQGNFKTSDILPFMEEFNLRLPSDELRNPWMKKAYGGERNGESSCMRTVEHFRQTRKFGCWGGRNYKDSCDAANTCIYHPQNPDQITNKCDLRKGVIWKREAPNSPYAFGSKYVYVVFEELLNGKGIPLKPLLAVFFPQLQYNENLIELFEKIFHINEIEKELFLY